MKKWLSIIGISVLIIVSSGIGAYLYVSKQIQGSEAEESFELTIERGDSLRQVLSELEASGMLGNARWRYLYMRFKQPDYTYQAGVYEIEQGMGLEEALTKFKNGDVAEGNIVEVTIPEGLNIKQIAYRLDEHGLGEADTYIDLLSDADYYEEKREVYPFLSPLQDEVKFPFEGYLYPDTYRFEPDASAEEVVDTLLSQTANVIETLAAEYPEIEEQLHRVFTLASIVEEETAVLEERPRVAGVFMNRLHEGMRLESDATVQYVLGKQKDRILYEDLEIEDPYNTYRNKGLPPGPIASPGLTSLKATLDPEDHDYLYFVTKKDGSRAHYFAKTFAEHKENRAKSMEHEKKSQQGS